MCVLFKESQTRLKANFHLNYLKKQIFTSWLKIKQESREDLKDLFLSGGPQTPGKLYVFTNAEYGKNYRL